MSNNSYLNQLLKDKLPDSTEVEIHFFELCNLRCHFCGQDHKAKEGLDLILDKIPRVIDFIENNQTKSHIINMMGGELFNDELPDSILEDYFKFAISVNESANKKGHRVHFNWVTNLIIKKLDRVQNLLSRLHQLGISSKISTSYDFAGRKTKLWDQELFLKNLYALKEHIYTVGFVLTKPAINSLIYGHDDVFEELYKSFPLYFDYYVPEAGAQQLLPSDQELLEALLYVAQKYPRISPVRELLENKENKMTCFSLNKLTLLPDGEEVKCRYLDYKPGQFVNPIDYNSNENIVESFIQENQCLSCEWFQKCSFRCFVQADWAQRVKMDRCLFKSFFESVEKWN